jgi:hypothetical protein
VYLTRSALYQAQLLYPPGQYLHLSEVSPSGNCVCEVACASSSTPPCNFCNSYAGPFNVSYCILLGQRCTFQAQLLNLPRSATASLEAGSWATVFARLLAKAPTLRLSIFVEVSKPTFQGRLLYPMRSALYLPSAVAVPPQLSNCTSGDRFLGQLSVRLLVQAPAFRVLIFVVVSDPTFQGQFLYPTRSALYLQGVVAVSLQVS